MKRLINILLGAGMLLVVWSCSSDLPLDNILSDTEFGIAMRSINEVNGLDLASMSSTYVHQFEIDAVDGGLVPGSIRILVGFTDDDETEKTDTAPADPANSAAPTEFATWDPDSFTETTDLNTHGLPVGTFTATLNELLAHLGLVAGDFDRGDEIDFEFEMIATDGTVFNKDNVGSNVAASGRFAFYNSPFAFTAMIDDPSRIVLESTDLAAFANSRLIDGDSDTVILDFDGSTFVVDPVIERISAGNNTDDSFQTTLTPYPFDVDDDDLFFFLYTAGSAATDTISFKITTAQSTAGNFAMVPVTFSKAFIIDNVAPTITLGGTGSRLTEETGGEIKAITVDVIFSEELTGDVTFTITSAQFTTETIVVEVKGEEVASFEFKPLLAGAELAATNVNFTVTASGANNAEGIDEAGNAVVGAIAISLL